MFLRKGAFLAGLISGSAATHYSFAPETAEVVFNPSLPVLANLTEMQLKNGGSFWSSSYLTASDNHQYLLISHALYNPSALVRSSILDITDTRNYWSNSTYVPYSNTTVNGAVNVTTDFFTYVSTSADAFTNQQTSMTTPDYSYDIAFNATSKAILNVAGNPFNFGTGDTTEAGLPNCRTTGTLTLNGKTLTIDPENSFTWYDRQYGTGFPTGNWTWFELHFPGSDVKVSAWAVDSDIPQTDTQWRFASVRFGDSQILLNTTMTSFYDKTFTSTHSNVTYPLAWNLDFGNGQNLKIESVRDDQEILGAKNLGEFAYEGFVKTMGNSGDSLMVTGLLRW